MPMGIQIHHPGNASFYLEMKRLSHHLQRAGRVFVVLTAMAQPGFRIIGYWES